MAFARSMRKGPVATEDLLWRLLRDRRLANLKFRRQVPIGPYIADFVCFRHKLIVEADGPRHEENVVHDQTRDAWLAAAGFRVLRFKNADVHGREQVLDQILAAVGLL